MEWNSCIETSPRPKVKQKQRHKKFGDQDGKWEIEKMRNREEDEWIFFAIFGGGIENSWRHVIKIYFSKEREEMNILARYNIRKRSFAALLLALSRTFVVLSAFLRWPTLPLLRLDRRPGSSQWSFDAALELLSLTESIHSCFSKYANKAFFVVLSDFYFVVEL